MKYIHNLSDVKSDFIGDDTRIWQYVVILPDAKIGSGCNICSHCFIENRVNIGDNVTIKSGVSVWNEISIEDDVLIGPNVAFTNDIYPRSGKHSDRYVPTIIRHNASIGANATIIAGIIIGEYALVGAGAVVTKSIPPHSVWYGNPATMKGYVCSCGEILPDSLVCSACGSSFEMMDSSNISQKH